MTVREILQGKGPGVITARPDQTVDAVLRKFRLHQIGAIVITDTEDRPLGIFTERDVVNGLLSHGKQLLHQPVGQVMSTRFPTCSLDDSVATTMQTMTDRRSRHLPVVEDGELHGIISIGDIVKSRVADLEYENRILRDISRARS